MISASFFSFLACTFVGNLIEMKIGFDAKRAFNNTAGLGNFSRNTIAALSRYCPQNQYFLFHSGNSGRLFVTPENARELKPQGVWWSNLKNLWRRFRLTGLAKENRLDIFHGLSHELPVGIERTGVKTVVTIHDLIFLRYPDYYPAIDRNIYDRKFRHACRIANRIHAISEQTRQDVIRFFAIPGEKIRVIYQAINPIFYESASDLIRGLVQEKYQLPEKFLLNVGTVEPRKNLLALLEGMISAKIEIPLIIVGKPTSYQLQVQSFLETHQGKLTVLFLTEVSDLELAALYQLAEVMIYPSVFEGFGLPVAEALASGCPVITSKTSSLPEAGGDAALLVNPAIPDEIGAAIQSVLSSSDLRNIMIEKGKVHALNFTPENFASQMKQLYNSLLNER
jgi:glycosyltransferase involved in cell wall biosynthesis